jgi:hypothetical protein
MAGASPSPLRPVDRSGRTRRCISARPAQLSLLLAEEAQDRVVECDGILQECEMADIGEDQDSGAWNRCGDIVGMLPLDALVVLAVHHPTDVRISRSRASLQFG